MAKSFYMKASEVFSNLFRFRKTSLTLFAVISYVSIVLLDCYAEYSSLKLPEKIPYYLNSAWHDLQEISREPHPYTSHENDVVFRYILKKAQEYSARNPDLISVDNDFGDQFLFKQFDVFNVTSTYAKVVYYESSNVYAKVKGRNSSLPGLLISAHYDSVPTAYGTTDDGMGIASMLGLLDFYSTQGEQPLRDIVFNFNNQEEYGSFGAESFFRHKWSENVKNFINLEGTGAGGRSILFRVSNYGLAKHYKSVPSPFASSLFQEGFSNKFVGSETDYSNYVHHGLQGFDIAFYKPRSLYHTYRDSISETSKNSLYHMLSNTLALAQEMSSLTLEQFEQDVEYSADDAVYFDILGKFLVVFPITKLYITNVAIVVIVPIVLLIMLIIVSQRGTWLVYKSKFSAIIRLPVSLVVAYNIQVWISNLVETKNPLIVTHYSWILLMLVSVSILANYTILNLFNNVFKIHDQKLIILLEITFGLWIWTIISTVRVKPPSVNTGEWASSILLVLSSVSTFFGLLGLCFRKNNIKKEIFIEELESPESAEQQGVNSTQEPDAEDVDEDGNEDGDEDGDEADDDEEYIGEPNETTPLLVRKKITRVINSLNYDWSIQFVLLVPVSLYFIYFNVNEVLEALYQNSHDGVAAVDQLYKILNISCFLLTLPLLGFVHKINYLSRMVLISFIILGTIVSSTKFPFSYDNPLKVSFYQVVDDTGTDINIIGSSDFLLDYLRDIPSIKNENKNVTCSPVRRPGTSLCSFEGPKPNLLSNSTSSIDDIMSIKVLDNKSESGAPSPYEPVEVILEITAKEGRHCLVTFNTSTYETFKFGKSPVRLLTVYHSNFTSLSSESVYSSLPNGYSEDEAGNQHFKRFKGIDSIQLHKLNWQQDKHVIGLEWLPRWFDDEPSEGFSKKLGLNLECYWGEYDREVLVDGEIKRMIPAYDELMKFSPKHIIYTKAYPGLVLGRKYVEL